MQYDTIFKDPLFYVFRKKGSNEYFFTGIFGSMGAVPRSILMSGQEYNNFVSDKRKYLQELWNDIEKHTEKYHSRFVDDVESNEDVISVIRETSFGTKKTSFLEQMLNKFK